MGSLALDMRAYPVTVRTSHGLGIASQHLASERAAGCVRILLGPDRSVAAGRRSGHGGRVLPGLQHARVDGHHRERGRGAAHRCRGQIR